MTVSAKDQLALMARYHVWATQRLMAAIAKMPDDLYRKPCGLFFGSVHGTLNHLLLTDGEIWYPRFTGRPITRLPLDAEIETDRTVLADRLVEAAQRWSAYIESLEEVALAGDLHFTATNGQNRVLPMAGALSHVFNHATHHRGQVTAALTMLGFDYEPLDLAYLLFAEQVS